MHGLDYFCEINKITLKELADFLGIKKSAPTNWKNGSKNFADKHKRSIIKLFCIPEGKEFLLEVKEIDDLDKAEIELVFYQNQLIKLKLNHKMSSEEVFKLDALISDIHKRIKGLKLINKLKMNIESSLDYEDVFNEKLIILENSYEKLISI